MIHSTDLDFKIIHWVSDGKRKPHFEETYGNYGDVQWATWSIYNGWPVQGIFQARSQDFEGHVRKDMDGSSIKAVAVSDPNETDPKAGALVVCGQTPQVSPDNKALVLYRYPCTNEKDEGRYFAGHAAYITNVKFMRDGHTKEPSKVISTGGRDLTVMQWKIV